MSPKSKVALTVTVVMFMMSCVPSAATAAEVISNPFADLDDDHAMLDEFLVLYGLRVFEGYEDGTVGLEDTLIREEYAKVAGALLNKWDDKERLSDVEPDFADSQDIAAWAYGWLDQRSIRSRDSAGVS